MRIWVVFKETHQGYPGSLERLIHKVFLSESAAREYTRESNSSDWDIEDFEVEGT